MMTVKQKIANVIFIVETSTFQTQLIWGQEVGPFLKKMRV